VSSSLFFSRSCLLGDFNKSIAGNLNLNFDEEDIFSAFINGKSS
jgi:hypothetical protein